MKIKDTIDNFIQDGIFTSLSSHFDWITEQDAITLNIEYYLNNGEKTISPVYKKLLDIPTLNPLNELTKIILLKYKDKWNRLYVAFVESTYNPINNYDMKEDEKIGSKIKTKGTTKNGNYGFNSSNSVPTSDSVGETVSEGSIDDNHRILTRSGNIGVTTSQQMIQSELDLRRYNFISSIIRDVNSVLTLYIYD